MQQNSFKFKLSIVGGVIKFYNESINFGTRNTISVIKKICQNNSISLNFVSTTQIITFSNSFIQFKFWLVVWRNITYINNLDYS